MRTYWENISIVTHLGYSLFLTLYELVVASEVRNVFLVADRIFILIICLIDTSKRISFVIHVIDKETEHIHGN